MARCSESEEGTGLALLARSDDSETRGRKKESDGYWSRASQEGPQHTFIRGWGEGWSHRSGIHPELRHQDPTEYVFSVMGVLTARDRYGREVNNIRVSVTQRCNLNCFYCHREGERASTGVEMTPAEIGRIVSVAARLGTRKVKITGGEPLIREDIADIVREIKKIAGIDEVSMTTNGVLLGPLAKILKMAGLNRVNVSLDSISDSTFKSITGSDALQEVLRGVDQAIEARLTPVKVNMVLLNGINETQVWSLVDFTRRKRIILQLIEFESPRENEMYRKYHLDLACVEQRIREQSREILTRSMHHRQRFMLEGGGEVEIVKPMHNTEFCSCCNRIRVASDGKFRPCLLDSKYLVDFLTPMRRGASDGELERLFLQAVRLRRPFFTEPCTLYSKTRL